MPTSSDERLSQEAAGILSGRACSTCCWRITSEVLASTVVLPRLMCARAFWPRPPVELPEEKTCPHWRPDDGG